MRLPDSPLREVKEKNKNRIKNSLNAIGIFIVTFLESIAPIHFTDAASSVIVYIIITNIFFLSFFNKLLRMSAAWQIIDEQ